MGIASKVIQICLFALIIAATNGCGGGGENKQEFTNTVEASRKDVLVIVNDNSTDSVQIGTYYQQQRQLDAGQVVHIKVPNQYYISWTEFQSLRDQILRYGICPSVAASTRPDACSDAGLPIYTAENISALTSQTRIRYLVTTRGVPTRMTVDGSTLYSPNESTSVDNYLRFWLARYLTADTPFSAFIDRAKSFGDGRGMRIIDPTIDQEYIIGRIDGLDLNSAMALIDRAVRTEANGWYGKLYGSTFGNTGGVSIFKNYATNQPIYGDATTSWRYAFGLMGEQRPECSDYASPSHYFAFLQADPNGKSPRYCQAQFTKGVPNDITPGHPSSRSPLAWDALAYFGSLDGQTIAGGFPTLLNWRKNDSCTVTLCANAADPIACRLNSIDPLREINTECVGVADGFIGYNFQSFPMSILSSWPTGWGPYSVDQSDPVQLLDTSASNGTTSAWFIRPDETLNPVCYNYSNGNFDGTIVPCTGKHKLGLAQTINVSSTDPANPPSYHMSYQIKGSALQTAGSINGFMRFNYPKDTVTACPTGLVGLTTDTSCRYTTTLPAALPVGDTNWTLVQRDITPPANTGMNFTSITIGFTGTLNNGQVGLDAVSVTELNTTTELVRNGSFEEGHQQTGDGDFAANFLSRLGGTAFWGSLSHHYTAGHSFDQTSLTSLVYLNRGLPLGDAVWLGEGGVSGIMYGDPLYSPIAVQLKYNLPNAWNMVTGQVALTGSAVNGTDASRVTTTYQIDYCTGLDFYLCGNSSNPWKATGLAGSGGQRNMSFGTWDTRMLPNGQYTLRLEVSSTNKDLGKTQAFYDYVPVIVYDSTSDADGDGLLDQLELSNYGTDPTKADTDGDGLSDSDEINLYHTNPLLTDSDGDGLSDYAEVITYHSNPLITDTDGDGYNDYQEVTYGGNPNDPLVAPLTFISAPLTVVEADVTNTYQFSVNRSDAVYGLQPVQSGIQIDPVTGVFTWKPDFLLAGQTRLISVSAQSGGFSRNQLNLVKIVAINNGDINEDGVVDLADVTLAEQFAAGTLIPTERQKARADVVHDLVIDNADVTAISNMAAGL